MRGSGAVVGPPVNEARLNLLADAEAGVVEETLHPLAIRAADAAKIRQDQFAFGFGLGLGLPVAGGGRPQLGHARGGGQKNGGNQGQTVKQTAVFHKSILIK